jgi:hypothetical protein
MFFILKLENNRVDPPFATRNEDSAVAQISPGRAIQELRRVAGYVVVGLRL